MDLILLEDDDLDIIFKWVDNVQIFSSLLFTRREILSLWYMIIFLLKKYQRS